MEERLIEHMIPLPMHSAVSQELEAVIIRKGSNIIYADFACMRTNATINPDPDPNPNPTNPHLNPHPIPKPYP